MAGAVLALAACSKTNNASTGSTGGSDASVTVKAANVSGVGTVLVNGNGQTLYILTSEAGGKITCTDASGCTKVWPDTELPSGMSAGVAGSGIQASLFSTVRSSDGSLYLTYAGYPLYTYSGDNAIGTANGQNITSFGGTWEAMNPNGTPVTGAASKTSSNSNGYGGY